MPNESRVREFLAWFKEQADATPTLADDMAYNLLRTLALRKGWISEDEIPGPRPQGGDGGGP